MLLDCRATARTFLACAMITVIMTAHAEVAVAPREAYEWWAKVLAKFVDDSGRTNFAALAQSRADLDRFVAWIGEVSPRSNPRAFPTPAAALAYHLNAYNALAMAGVIDAGIPRDFASFFKRRRLFNWRTVKIGGVDTSLSAYENDVVRPFRDPRVHFALNCMVRDCPRLPRTPFQAETLDTTLNGLTFEFFTQANHLRIADATRELWVSSLLKFYTADFIGDAEQSRLVEFINRYRDIPVPADYRLRFMDYDWTVNRQP